MGRRTIAILIFIVGILALAVVGVLLIIGQDTPPPETAENGEPADGEVVDGETAEDGVSPDEVDALATLPPTNQVVVSLQTLPRGFRFPDSEEAVEDLLTYDERVEGQIPTNVVVNMEDVLGQYVRADIFQGQTITVDLLVDDPTLIGVEKYGPSSLIPSDFVAMAVPMGRLSGVAYGLKEGDYIDILLSFTFREVDPQFQSLLLNSVTFPIEVIPETTEGEEGEEVEEAEPETVFLVVDPLGRFEELPTGDRVHITPNEEQRPVSVAMILQNAKVIQVGAWQPRPLVQPATPTPEPVEDPEATPDPAAPDQQAQAAPPTPTPSPQTLLVALSPQQQLFLKYAVETNADIDFALRGINDGQLYSVENVDLAYLLQRFNIDVPSQFNFTIEGVEVTPTPETNNEGNGGEEGTVPE